MGLYSPFWKLCCFVIWLGVGTNLCYWLRLFCTFVDHSEAISLVWTTRGFYPWFEGFSTLKILVPLFVLLVIYYCCSLIIAPHRFLQVRENYICCILWYIVCCCFPIINRLCCHFGAWCQNFLQQKTLNNPHFRTSWLPFCHACCWDNKWFMSLKDGLCKKMLFFTTQII